MTRLGPAPPPSTRIGYDVLGSDGPCAGATHSQPTTTRRALDAEVPERGAATRPRYNVAPGEPAPIVWRDPAPGAARRLMDAAVWGMLGADDNRLHINARSETVHTKPTFRDALLTRRCLVPADGFYEWTGERRHRLPIWFHRPQRRLTVFAGLYQESVDSRTGQVRRRFAILTTRPNDLVAPVHDRMPVILNRESWASWLAPPPTDIHTWPGVLERLKRMLAPLAHTALLATEVSDRANRAGHDDATCIAPMRHPRQQSLF